MDDNIKKKKVRRENTVRSSMSVIDVNARRTMN
jgi:hypothetical protein